MAPARSIADLQRNLDYKFRDRSLLRRALTHTSVEHVEDFERLEFLGDRVLALIVTELLLEAFPGEDEGAIGRRFASLVRAETLAAIGRQTGIDAAIIHGGNGVNDSIVADATEAVIAALYLDGTYAAAARFVARYWTPLIRIAELPPRDPKTALQEWSQAHGLGLPKYREISREGPDHVPLFTVEVAVVGRAPVQATGLSKRAAEQAAAETLLAVIEARDE